MKEQFWIVVDRNGYPCAVRESADDAEDHCSSCDKNCRHYAPHRAVCVVPLDEVEPLRAVLIEAVERYGKPGGPWNVPSDPGGWIARAKAALAGLRQMTTPIDKLVARYESEDCDFADTEWVRSVALRYVETMPDSQVRCLLYVLASSADAEARISAAVAAERERCAALCSETASGIDAEAIEAAIRSASERKP